MSNVGYINLNKVFAPHVMPMAKEVIVVPRRLLARTARPHQWQVTRRSHIVDKELKEGGRP